MAASLCPAPRRRWAKPLGGWKASPRRIGVLLLAASVSWRCGPLLFATEAPSNKELGRSPETRSLYVGNLPWSTRGEELRVIFEEAGTVLRSEVEMIFGKKSRGWGTVTMSTPEEAVKAAEKFDGFTIRGSSRGNATERQLTVNLEKRCLVLSNLPDGSTFETIKGLFDDLAIARPYVNLGLFPNETSPGHAVVIFKTEEDAQKALSMNEKEMGGWTLYVGHF